MPFTALRLPSSCLGRSKTSARKFTLMTFTPGTAVMEISWRDLKGQIHSIRALTCMSACGCVSRGPRACCLTKQEGYSLPDGLVARCCLCAVSPCSVSLTLCCATTARSLVNCTTKGVVRFMQSPGRDPTDSKVRASQKGFTAFPPQVTCRTGGPFSLGASENTGFVPRNLQQFSKLHHFTKTPTDVVLLNFSFAFVERIVFPFFSIFLFPTPSVRPLLPQEPCSRVGFFANV